jgi:hypothetical protein
MSDPMEERNNLINLSEMSEEGQNLVLMTGLTTEFVNMLTKYNIKKVEIVGKKIVFRGEGKRGVWLGEIDMTRKSETPVGFKLPKRRKKADEGK